MAPEPAIKQKKSKDLDRKILISALSLVQGGVVVATWSK